MRIVHIIWGLCVGGAETMLTDIINEQVKSEEVALSVINDNINQALLDKIDSRCTVMLSRRKIGSKSLLPWIKLNVFLWKYHPDIIHFHLEGMRRMVFYPAPKVFTIHNTHTTGVEYSKYKALYAISNAVKKTTEKQGFDATTVWNGIHPDEIVAKQINATYKIPEKFRFVCVGRLYTPHKGQDVLIKALSKLKLKGITVYQLDFIGDGSSRNELEALVKQSGLQNNITFLGQKEREFVYQHLCDYDLYILPSRSEGFGLTVAEAMCAKIPVLVSDLEGPMEVIDNGRLGMHFKSEDADDLAFQLEHFIKNGIDTKLTESAYMFARNNFNISIVAEKYINEYKKIVK